MQSPFLPVKHQHIPPKDPQDPPFQPNLFHIPALTNSIRFSPLPVNHFYDEHESLLLTLLLMTSSYIPLSSLGIETLAS